MNDVTDTVKRAEKLHTAAAEAFRLCNYSKSECLYRGGIKTITSVLDPLHTSYIEMLKGLLSALLKQNKNEDADTVRVLILQMCQGQ